MCAYLASILLWWDLMILTLSCSKLNLRKELIGLKLKRIRKMLEIQKIRASVLILRTEEQANWLLISNKVKINLLRTFWLWKFLSLKKAMNWIQLLALWSTLKQIALILSMMNQMVLINRNLRFWEMKQVWKKRPLIKKSQICCS